MPEEAYVEVLKGRLVLVRNEDRPGSLALHGSRLDLFMRQLIDSTVRGFIYEASLPAAQSGGSAVPAGVLGEGALTARALGARNAIPVAVIEGTAADAEGWIGQMRAAARSLLSDVRGQAR